MLKASIKVQGTRHKAQAKNQGSRLKQASRFKGQERRNPLTKVNDFSWVHELDKGPVAKAIAKCKSDQRFQHYS